MNRTICIIMDFDDSMLSPPKDIACRAAYWAGALMRELSAAGDYPEAFWKEHNVRVEWAEEKERIQ